MCGLCGEVRFDGAAPDLAAVDRMSCRMEPRGPNGQGVWQSGPVALAHRRLAIIDLSAAGAQPMVESALGLSVVFNGCIYNYRELRDELRAAGYEFFSMSDTEVVAKAYHRWGTDCVRHFKGMFAFAVSERATGRLVLARDRLGIKPLYLSHRGDRLRFASSLPALLAAGDVDTSIDPVALHHYMTFHAVVPPPRTILTGVRKLPPATVRVYEPDGRSTDTVYWSPSHDRRAEDAGLTQQDWQDRVLDGLRTAVRRRMVADVPVGVLLSGGIDSSVIVALLAEQGQHGLQTFSIGFERVGDREGDEFVFSDLVAREFDTDHHRIMVPTADLFTEVDGMLDAMSEPMVSHDCIAFYLLSKYVSRSVKVVQSGQGADEILAGYDWYPPLAAVVDDDLDGALSTYSGRFFDRTHAELAQILMPPWLAPDDPSRALAAAHFARPGAGGALDRALRLDSQVMLVDDPVKRVDTMTMAWGLEARVPFLDHEFVELAAAVPPALKLAQQGKGVLKEASRSVLPAEVIDRPKGHFPVPAIINLQGPYLDRVVDALHAPEAKQRGLFRPQYVQHLLTDPNRFRTNLGSNQLWQIGLLEMWLQHHGVG
ncbi:N-acetylglutaminylglutamine amidotransferase [Nakamurella leprariae]|uniref:asparagine synthase (glutamine-hydrolyzing) n=1 Tax=Nakamurella leprariae TaxID=2803911 RepID=A0A939BXE9_9ACTN|nr:N-acetylglutaminylglutamine amidotransferase [Nakamurella leprariae]MBM9468488.1 N-acetylglutaminylglutamine amidotransferase [Nakamurella leprariae]